MKRAVVLGGGGSRGAYQIGVWRFLREIGYKYDIVCGTSVGSLNAALMAQDDYDLAVKLWSNMRTSDVLDLDDADRDTPGGRRKVLREFIDSFVKEGGVDPAPLENMVRSLIDEDKIRSSQIEFGLVTVEFPSMKPFVMTKDNIPEGQICDYLMASASCFPAMKRRQIGSKQYIDGGYYSVIPTQIAIDAGAEEIITVDLESVGINRPVMKKDRNIIKIVSKWDLGPLLSFDPDAALHNMKLGYVETKRTFGLLEGEYYGFYPGESANNRKTLIETVREVSDRIRSEGGQGRLGILEVDALKRCLGSEPSVAPPRIVRKWAETAGRVLGIDPAREYSFGEFNLALLHSAEKIEPLPQSIRTAIENSPKRNSDLKKIIRDADGVSLVAFLKELMENDRETAGYDAMLTVLSTVAPKEFVTAFYVVVLLKSGVYTVGDGQELLL